MGKPTLKIIFDHDKDREAHARQLVRHHLKKADEKFPRIQGASMANVPRNCACGRLFWAQDNSDRWDCYECAPQGKKEGFGFG